MAQDHSGAAGAGDRAVVGSRPVDIAVSTMLLALAALFAYDNWRSGAGWDKDGPQSGYFPFYLSLLLGGAALVGLAAAWRRRGEADVPFVDRGQLRRVLQVFLPTLVFVALIQAIGLYVASLLFVAAFMRGIGGMPAWKSGLTGLIFAVAMFFVFEVQFKLLLPQGPIEDWLRAWLALAGSSGATP